jgi:hypothetical protein
MMLEVYCDLQGVETLYEELMNGNEAQHWAGALCTNAPCYAAQSDKSIEFLTTAVHTVPAVLRESLSSSLEHYTLFPLQFVVMINSAQLDGIALVVGVGYDFRTSQTKAILTNTTSQGEVSERRLRFLSLRREQKLSSSQMSMRTGQQPPPKKASSMRVTRIIKRARLP